MDSGGIEHAALAVDDQSPMVVAHVERLEEGRGAGRRSGGGSRRRVQTAGLESGTSGEEGKE